MLNQQSTADPVLSVSDVTECLKLVIEAHFVRVQVAGEISNCVKAGSGHVYFTLKDDGAQLKAVMWRSAASRLRFQLQDGLQVIATGPIELYQARGHYQLIVEQLVPAGLGPLELALRQLQAKLAAEGLFDQARKRALPRFPRKIGIITSPSGAAIRDLLQVMTRRWPGVQVVVFPVAVQGDGARKQIASAFRQVPLFPEIDVVITGRGGGSIEDLWAFNEEIVARAITNCAVPVISAVGHETDVTIADLVADRRALTPSEAAELATPLAAELREDLALAARRMEAIVRQTTSQYRRVLDQLASRRALAKPKDILHLRARQIDDLEMKLQKGIRTLLRDKSQLLNGLAASLDALSPLAVLSRGYSLTKRLKDGQLVRSTNGLSLGDRISTLLGEGELVSEIVEMRSDE